VAVVVWWWLWRRGGEAWLGQIGVGENWWVTRSVAVQRGNQVTGKAQAFDCRSARLASGLRLGYEARAEGRRAAEVDMYENPGILSCGITVLRCVVGCCPQQNLKGKVCDRPRHARRIGRLKWSRRKETRSNGTFLRPTWSLCGSRPGQGDGQTSPGPTWPFDREQGGQIGDSGCGPVGILGKRTAEYLVPRL
jgi:hypothetical protein